MRVAEVTVKRSEHHTATLLVGAWEILILQFEHTPEAVNVLGFKILEGRAYPDPQQEFERLSQRYGKDTESDASKASLTYGQGQMGVMNLRNLIEQERKAEAEGSVDLQRVQLVSNVVALPEAVAPAAVPAPVGKGTETLSLPRSKAG